MSMSESRLAPPTPFWTRTLAAERAFFRDMVDDLSLRIEWLGQTVESIPDANARLQMHERVKALSTLHRSIVRVAARLSEPPFARLFALEGPLAAFLSRLFAWCEEVATEFEGVAIRRRRGERGRSILSDEAIHDSFEHFSALGAALRRSLARSHPTAANVRGAWMTFDADVEELVRNTESMHTSLSRKALY